MHVGPYCLIGHDAKAISIECLDWIFTVHNGSKALPVSFLAMVAIAWHRPGALSDSPGHHTLMAGMIRKVSLNFCTIQLNFRSRSIFWQMLMAARLVSISGVGAFGCTTYVSRCLGEAVGAGNSADGLGAPRGVMSWPSSVSHFVASEAQRCAFCRVIVLPFGMVHFTWAGVLPAKSINTQAAKHLTMYLIPKHP